MHQRRRLSTPHRRPVLAAVFASAMVAAAAVGTPILHTAEPDGGPVPTMIETTAFAEGANVLVDDPAIVTQGEEQGPKTVKEFTREQPFSMFALTWTSDHDIAAFFRAMQADGTWTEWYDAETLTETSPRDNGKNGTEPIYVSPTTRIQVSTTGVDALEPPADLDAVFIDGNAEAGGIALTADSDGLDKVVSRKGWGADESIRCQSPTYDDGVSAITIHHTAGNNNYSRAEAASIVRGIYKYHAQTLGWCDIGYNALVDKFGTIYEGRYGGLNKAVQGAHAGGFNENTWGISMIGNYSNVAPSQATINAVGALAGWKAKVSGFDPEGYDTHYSEGTTYSKYPYGAQVTLPNIFAHRDVGNTECPGNSGYAQMGQIRTLAKKKYMSIGGTPANIAPSPVTPGTPDDVSLSDFGSSSFGSSDAETAPAPATNPTGDAASGAKGNTGASLQETLQELDKLGKAIKEAEDKARNAGLVQ